MKIIEKLKDRYTMYDTVDGFYSIKIKGLKILEGGTKKYDLGDGYVGVHDLEAGTLEVIYKQGLGTSYEVLGREMSKVREVSQSTVAPTVLAVMSDGVESGLREMKANLEKQIALAEKACNTNINVRLLQLLSLDIIMPLIIAYYTLKVVSL